MARRFESASFEYGYTTSVPVTSVPLTLACHFRQVGGNSSGLVELHKNNAGGHKFTLAAVGGSGTVPIARSAAGTGTQSAFTTAAGTVGVWHTAVGVFESNSARHVYLDGANKGSNTDSASAPSGIDRLKIGIRDWSGSPQSYSDADIAWVAIWDAALTDDEVAAFGDAKFDPRFVRPQNLLRFFPFGGLDGDHDRCLLTGDTITWVATPDWTEHPSGLIYRDEPHKIIATAAEGGASGMSCSKRLHCMGHNQILQGTV